MAKKTNNPFIDDPLNTQSALPDPSPELMQEFDAEMEQQRQNPAPLEYGGPRTDENFPSIGSDAMDVVHPIRPEALGTEGDSFQSYLDLRTQPERPDSDSIAQQTAGLENLLADPGAQARQKLFAESTRTAELRSRAQSLDNQVEEERKRRRREYFEQNPDAAFHVSQDRAFSQSYGSTPTEFDIPLKEFQAKRRREREEARGIQPIEQAGQPELPEDATPKKSKYRTGQVHQFDNQLSTGRKSTTVYTLQGGIGLPDGQGMTNEEFVEAFQQMNPDVSLADAVAAASLEPGTKGSAAQKIMRDIGTIGDVTNLTDAQRQSVEQQIGDRAAYLLRSHAQSMGAQINQGASALRREDDERTKDREKIEARRRQAAEQALVLAQQRMDDDSGIGPKPIFNKVVMEEFHRIMSQDALADMMSKGLQLPYEGPMEYAARIAGPDFDPGSRTTVPEEGEGTIAIGASQDAVFVSDALLREIPNARIAKNGNVVYDLADGRAVPADVEPTADGTMQIIPKISSDGDEELLPGGTVYRNAFTNQLRTTTRAAEEDSETDAQEEARKFRESQEFDAEGAYDTAQSSLTKRQMDLYDVKLTSLTQDRDSILKGLTDYTEPEEIAIAQNEVNEKNQEIREIVAAASTHTAEEINAEIDLMREIHRQKVGITQQQLLISRDPAAYRREVNKRYSGELGYAGGQRVYNVGGTNVSTREIGNNIHVPDPQTAEEAKALGFKNGILHGQDMQLLPDEMQKTNQANIARFEKLQKAAQEKGIEGRESVRNTALNFVAEQYPNMPDSEFPATIEALMMEAGFYSAADLEQNAAKFLSSVVGTEK